MSEPCGTDAGVRELAILRVTGNRAAEAHRDFLAVEEPLEIQLGYVQRGWRVHKSVSVTMRTPGHDAELAVGFLFTEGILRDPAAQIERVGPPDGDEREKSAGNVVRVELREGVEVDLRRLERHFYTSSSCGVCGKTSIDALGLTRPGRKPLAAGGHHDGQPVMFDAALIHRLPDALRETQEVFERTGGLHAAGLFDAAGTLLGRREDVGRHNAVDKLIGAQLLLGGDHEAGALAGRLLFVSGRASFELIQKALAAGIPALAAVGAPSSLAVDLARAYGATLLGFVRDGRFNVYSGAARLGGLNGKEVPTAENGFVASRKEASGDYSPDRPGVPDRRGRCRRE